MNEPITDNEKLFMMFSGMSDQLAELESVLRTSFSDLRSDLIREEAGRLTLVDKRISNLEQRYMKREELISEEFPNYAMGKTKAAGLKLELGF